MAQALTDAPWLEVMRSRIGIREIPGKKHNPLIVSMFKDVGHHEVVDDETAWCAAAMGSALVACSLPVPAKNVNLMARSYCTYGVRSAPKPGAIAIWPRGKSDWQGHVNVVDETRERKGKLQVKCIGGNQSNAMTRTDWQDSDDALDFRWPVLPTVPELRKSGSTEIKKGDHVQNTGIFAVFIAPVVAAIKELLYPITQVPQFSNINDGLSFWQTVLGGVNAVGKTFMDNPWLGGTVAAGLVLGWIGHTIKRARVDKAKAGVPLSVENAAMGVA